MSKLNETLVCNRCNTHASINAVFCHKCGNQLFFSEYNQVGSEPKKTQQLENELSQADKNGVIIPPPQNGLSESNSSLIAGTFFMMMLLYGAGMFSSFILRIVFLTLIPIALLWGLKYWGKKWNIGKVANDRLFRLIFGLIGVTFIVLAIFSWNKKYHSECAEPALGRDEIDCIGDYVVVKGPDKREVAMELVFTLIAFSMAFSKKNED